MVSTSKEYIDVLYRINSQNPPSVVNLVPKTEKIYNIDLNTRGVETPEYLSVSKDHKAEVIHFKVARYFDNMDLSTTSCIIQYKNAKRETHLYIVPYYDVTTLSYGEPNYNSEMIIPWLLEGPVTSQEGIVEFSFKFFKTNGFFVFKKLNKNEYIPNYYYVEDNESNKYIISSGEFDENAHYYELRTEISYSLNTLPAKSKILNGMEFSEKYLIASLDERSYFPGFYYIKNENEQYVLCSEESYNQFQTYYELGVPELSIDNSLLAKATYIINRLENLNSQLDLYWETL